MTFRHLTDLVLTSTLPQAPPATAPPLPGVRAEVLSWTDLAVVPVPAPLARAASVLECASASVGAEMMDSLALNRSSACRM